MNPKLDPENVLHIPDVMDKPQKELTVSAVKSKLTDVGKFPALHTEMKEDLGGLFSRQVEAFHTIKKNTAAQTELIEGLAAASGDSLNAILDWAKNQGA